MTSSIPRGRIDVWHVHLEDIDPDDNLLSEDEKRRANRFADRSDRNRFQAGRIWLRTRLSEYTGRDPGGIEFRYGRYGRPTIDGPAVEFSLAHSGSAAVLAVGWEKPLGIDIERWRPDVFDALSARLVLSPAELALVEMAIDKDRMFLKCWTRKEAYSKVNGGGLDRHLAEVTLTYPNETAVQHWTHEVSDWEWSGTTVAIAIPVGHQLNWR
jgi:4'-phosphopantetheinyl transferase